MTTAVISHFVGHRKSWEEQSRPVGLTRAVAPEKTGSSQEALLSIRDLRVSFDTGSHLVPVLHGVDLDLLRGETLGVVGESGCGKSVTWMAVMRLLGNRARISGQIRLEGEDISRFDERAMTRVRGNRIAMIFQDPSSSLNPVQTIGRQLTEAIRLHQGLRGDAARAEAVRLLERVNIPSARTRLSAWPHELSGGMNQRVMIAMALAGQPELLVADEPTTALDVTIQAQILDLLQDLQKETGMGLVLISHDLGVIAQVCDRVMVMYAGRVVEQAPATALFTQPRHPYTRGLMAALPDLDGPVSRLRAIAGTVPSPTALPKGCSFAPRCQARTTLCEESRPGLLLALPEGHVNDEHTVACWEARP